MSDEVQETEEVTTTTDESTEDEGSQDDNLSIEDYKRIVAKLRREAGSRRLKAKEVEEKLKEYDDWKKSQMSEVDRVKAERAELETELKQYRMEKLQKSVAAKAKLDAEFADLIKGDSEEEMLAHAKTLKARLATSGNPEGTRPGVRGAPVGGDAHATANEWFLEQMRSAS